MHLVLASTSPYRKTLLSRLGLPFVTAKPAVDETPLPGETPEQLVRRLAEAKAKAVVHLHPKSLIIGSDQAAVMDGKIIGKPGDHARAVAQLQAASGKRLEFLTGLCLLHAASGRVQIDVVRYSVVFRPLTGEQIENYLRRELPYDCAGAFKSEGLGVALFERMEGYDPTAVIGLPLIALVRMLEEEGIEII